MKSNAESNREFSAIVIGVSAGGLHALIQVLGKLPADYVIPIIVVQHRGKEYKDLLEDVLQTKCLLKIKQADEKESIEPAHIYIAPADYHLLIEHDKTFSLTSDMYVKHSRPSIDLLFTTAAEVYKEKLLGIILTGASSDGAEGMREIRRVGGLTIAQDPLTAEYPYMPQASINIGAIDTILTLDEITSFLMRIYERG
ncbi:chemotaxis protein CheB [Cytophaga hutchinsonii]|jgi:two-component system chemotaxis response regulator CheB|uniref:protein-glutamate methylesterase n=1 Tax=Cytophaga hutchinsonii (strain ATCC 33406 / DSM 1761 / CIP 103989 / NBRC 15051 / NCIMB 9469 / D465) TaxID=269798 RepID=A0A6N4SSL2_CYTH3|nr:chemotaxis protein CheB [Cytophaga hutchinsonii]ABG59341.1 protein-glutamate methylesterase (chemotaxis-specific methylesterase) [Cytophaga hutchinsonii ATCC 33406]SFX92110.1 two-component system, chemotaxis family, response regulator CheB [Cytophaga hutchinsonii ATCC 33406]